MVARWGHRDRVSLLHLGKGRLTICSREKLYGAYEAMN
jgi:hypothetical protein